MQKALISFPMFGEGFILDPPAFIEIGTFKIYFYGMIIAFGFLLAVLYGSRNCDRLGMAMNDVYDFIVWAVILAIIGARLYYVVFYWSNYADDPLSAFSIRDGGLAIYGGVIGAILGLLICSRIKKMSVWPALDIMGFGLLIGQSIGRWGNFFNREAYGYETDIFCRMGLTLNGETTYVHPTFLYESLWNALGLLLLHLHSKKHRKYSGQYFLLYLMWYGLGRGMIEGLRSDSLWLIPDVIRVSQLLAVLSLLAALVLYILNARRLAAGGPPVFGKALDGNDIMEEETESQEESPVPCEDTAEEETEENKISENHEEEDTP